MFNIQQKFFGLDISDFSIKIVQLKKTKEKFDISACDQIDLKPGIIDNGVIKDEEKVKEKIKKLINNCRFGKITSDNVVACLPETKTFIKLIEIENSNEKDIDSHDSLNSIIIKEAEKHIPLPIQESYIDWQIIEKDKDALTVLIGAAYKKITEQYAKILADLNLTILALEIEEVAIARAILPEERMPNPEKNQGTKVILDIGASRSSFTAYDTNTILFTISLPISGKKMTESIAKSLNISYDEAEKKKIKCNLNSKSKRNIKARSVIIKILSEFANYVKKAIIFHNNHFYDHDPINQILLTGGMSNMPGIASLLAEKLNNQVDIANSLNSINKTEKIIDNYSKNYDQSASFTTAIGLALRNYIIEE